MSGVFIASDGNILESDGSGENERRVDVFLRRYGAATKRDAD